MAGTFSAQLQRQQAQQVQKRLTRTQRLQAQEQENISKAKFEALQNEAERLKITKFSNLTFDQYQQEYNKLSPELQQFFKSPSEISAGIQQKKAEDIQGINSQIETLKERIRMAQHGIDATYANRARDKIPLDEGDYSFIERKQLDIQEAQSQINSLQEGISKIEQGYDAGTIREYALEKAQSERERWETTDKARREAQQRISLGEKPIYDAGGNITGFVGKETELPLWLKGRQFQGGYKESDILYYQNVTTYAEQKGWEKLSPEMQNIVNPSYVEYEKIVKREQEKQQQAQETAQKFLKEQEFGQDIKEKPKEKWYENLWSGLKTIYYSSPFGINFDISETRLKEDNRQIFSLGRIGLGLPQISILSLSTEKAYKTIEYEEQLDYNRKQMEKSLEELETYKTKVYPEIKDYIETEGIKILEEKGLQTKTITTIEKLEGGETRTITEKTIIDPMFERKLSYTTLEHEKFLEKGVYIKLSTLIPATKDIPWFKERKVTPSSLIGFGVKGIETILLLEGAGAIVRGAIKGGTYATKIFGAGYKIESVSGASTNLFGRGVISSTQKYTMYKGMEGYVYAPALAENYELLSGGTKLQAITKVSKIGLKTGFNIGITGLYAYGKVKQYQSIVATSGEAGKDIFFATTAGELLGIEAVTGIGRNTYRRAKSWTDNWNVKLRKEADLTMQGFYRENKLLGGKEHVYMERYQGLKLSKPKTWLQYLEGYKKGEFLGQVQKLAPDEVTAYYKYGADVDIYNLEGKFVRHIRASPFPYAPPSSHYKWATEKNTLEFGTRGQKKLPINVKEYKGFVYSATRQRWEYVEFKPENLYVNGKKVAELKGALRFGSVKGTSEAFLGVSGRGEESAVAKEASSPTIYANYLKNVQVNKAIGELKGITESGIEVKYPIYTKDTGIAGTGNIGMLKTEPELTYEFEKALKIRVPFAIRRGLWKIPVVEEIVGSAGELETIRQTTGIKTAIEKVGISSMPSSSQSLNKAIYSIIRYSSPSRQASYKSSVISKISKPSRISDVSRISRTSASSVASRISRQSRISDVSRTSRISDIMSEISRISRTSKIPKSRTSKPSRISTELLGKIKAMKRLKLSPEIVGLMPDFTARMLGLAPKQLSVKQAIREMNRIQTGFEVRTGARIKRYSPIDEKSLLKGIMK